MATKLTRRGDSVGLTHRITALVTRQPVAQELRPNYVLLQEGSSAGKPDITGYRAIVVRKSLVDDWAERASGIAIVGVDDLEGILDHYIVRIEPPGGFLRILFRPESRHNSLFATDMCNSNCIMCSQPPKDIDDSEMVEEHLRHIELIETAPAVMGITGGEPTLLGAGLVRILRKLKDSLPTTYVHMLTNGRQYSNPNLVESLAAVHHPAFTSAVPLYADIAGIHDYIVQSDGAFDQTIEGLYNAAEAGLSLEIRVVLHKQTIPRLPQLAEFIYRNLPFAGHVALMGLEHMGYVRKNWNDLWIDPLDYADQLQVAAETLHMRGMSVSIYNLPLCLVHPRLWGLARQSISDFKNIYLEACGQCSVKAQCSGLFLSQERRHSPNIRAVPAAALRSQ